MCFNNIYVLHNILYLIHKARRNVPHVKILFKTMDSRLNSLPKNYNFVYSYFIVPSTSSLTLLLHENHLNYPMFYKKNPIRNAFVFIKKNFIRTSQFIRADLRRVGTDACARFIRALSFSFKLFVRA